MIGALNLHHGKKLPTITLSILTRAPLRRLLLRTITDGGVIGTHLLQRPRLSDSRITRIENARGQGPHHFHLVQLWIACQIIKEKLIHRFVVTVL
jgi:hypothetical protein